MIRLVFIIIALFVSLDCSFTAAHGPGYRWRSNSSAFGFRAGGSRLAPNRFGMRSSGYGNYGYAGNGGFGYPGTFPASGFGYIYDPYATGSFKAPDLLNDPYFRESTRFDSHFPGR